MGTLFSKIFFTRILTQNIRILRFINRKYISTSLKLFTPETKTREIIMCSDLH